MDNAGVQTLCALQIGAAMPQSLLEPSPDGPADLSGMTAVTIDADFKFGSGSGTVVAIVATSFDGTVWRHIARFDFANASRVAQCNLEGLLSKGVTNYADLSAEGVNDGILGNQLALFLTVTGAYQGSTLSVRASVR